MQTANDYSVMNDGSVLRIPLNDIVDFSYGGNVRKNRDAGKYKELLADIEKNGVTNSITVRPSPVNPNQVEVLAGYGRLSASRDLAYTDIPAVLKTVDERAAMAIAISENLVRENLGLVDEAKAAQNFVGLANGDKEEAAKQLGWPVAKVTARLVLMQCCDAVLNALEAKEIKLGHAEILSQFTERLQQGTLQKILDEEWTVAYLKERANKANRLLATAKFDTTDCNTCQHNSSHQAALFDDSVGKAKCGNLVCFKAKTNEWLEGRKKELEENQVILIASDKPEDQRITVNAEQVGTEQFNSGCTGCESNVAILQDGINSSCGTVIENQCISLDCFRKCQKAHQDSLKLVEEKQTPVVDTCQQKADGKATGQGKNEKTTEIKPEVQVEKKISNAVKEDYRSFLRGVASENLLKTKTFKLAAALISNLEISKFKPTIEEFPTHGYQQQLQFACNLTVEVLSKALGDSIAYLASSTCDDSIKNHTDVMIGCFSKNDDQAIEKATSAWEPSKKNLSVHTKQSLTVICREAGFDKAFEIANGDGSFDKLAKKTKDDYVEGVLNFKFKWDGYIPKEIKELMKLK